MTGPNETAEVAAERMASARFSTTLDAPSVTQAMFHRLIVEVLTTAFSERDEQWRAALATEGKEQK